MARKPNFLRLARSWARLQSSVLRLASPALPAARAVRRKKAPPKASVFGSNPGALDMHLHLPPGAKAGAALIVVLHGCGQDARGFAAASGWQALSDQLRIPLLLPEQRAANHPNRCFHWYLDGDVLRGRGEAASIRQMLSHTMKRLGTDRSRVFIVGLSAGGAMTAAMLAAYPAVFAGGAIVAGLPAGTAHSSLMALRRMYRAVPFSTRAALVAAVRAISPGRDHRPWPPVSIWQGLADRTVDPANAELLADQWSGVHGLDAEPATDTAPAPGIRRRAWRNRAQDVVEAWTIEGLAHGFPVAPALDGGRAGPSVVDIGVPAALHIAHFWGLR